MTTLEAKPMTTSESLILAEVDGAVGVITLNRPKQLNALNSEVAAGVIAAATKFENDPKIGCIVLTGSERAFAAGADIEDIAIGKIFRLRLQGSPHLIKKHL